MYFKLDLTGFMFTSEFNFFYIVRHPEAILTETTMAVQGLSHMAESRPSATYFLLLPVPGCVPTLFLPAASYTFNNEHSLPLPGESSPGQCTPYFYKHFPNI